MQSSSLDLAYAAIYAPQACQLLGLHTFSITLIWEDIPPLRKQVVDQKQEGHLQWPNKFSRGIVAPASCNFHTLQ